MGLIVLNPGALPEFVESFEQQEVLKGFQGASKLRASLKLLSDFVNVSPALVLGVFDLLPSRKDLLVHFEGVEVPHLGCDFLGLIYLDPVVQVNGSRVLLVHCEELLLQLSQLLSPLDVTQPGMVNEAHHVSLTHVLEERLAPDPLLSYGSPGSNDLVLEGTLDKLYGLLLLLLLDVELSPVPQVLGLLYLLNLLRKGLVNLASSSVAL